MQLNSPKNMYFPHSNNYRSPSFLARQRDLGWLEECQPIPGQSNVEKCKKDGAQISGLAGPADTCLEQVNKFMKGNRSTEVKSRLYDPSIPGISATIPPNGELTMTLEQLFAWTNTSVPLSVLAGGGSSITVRSREGDTKLQSIIDSTDTDSTLRIDGPNMNLGESWVDGCGDGWNNGNHDPYEPEFYKMFVGENRVCKSDKKLEVTVSKEYVDRLDAHLNFRVGVEDSKGFDTHGDVSDEPETTLNFYCNNDQDPCKLEALVFNAEVPASAKSALPMRCLKNNYTSPTTPPYQPSNESSTSHANLEQSSPKTEVFIIAFGLPLTLAVAIFCFLRYKLNHSKGAEGSRNMELANIVKNPLINL